MKRHHLPFYARKSGKLFIPFATILITCIAFPLAINALEILASPKDQIFAIRAHNIASQYGAQITAIDPQKSIILRIPPSLCIGTDTQVEKAAMLFHKLCSLNPKLLLYVYEMFPRRTFNGNWDPSTKDAGERFINIHQIPSRINPMTLEWTTKLISDQH